VSTQPTADVPYLSAMPQPRLEALSLWPWFSQVGERSRRSRSCIPGGRRRWKRLPARSRRDGERSNKESSLPTARETVTGIMMKITEHAGRRETITDVGTTAERGWRPRSGCQRRET